MFGIMVLAAVAGTVAEWCQLLYVSEKENTGKKPRLVSLVDSRQFFLFQAGIERAPRDDSRTHISRHQILKRATVFVFSI